MAVFGPLMGVWLASIVMPHNHPTHNQVPHEQIIILTVLTKRSYGCLDREMVVKLGQQAEI